MDSWLEGSLHGPTTLWVVLLVSLLLGLRHASDPDHLAAVSTLIASEEHEGVRKATFMGFSWGLGHGTTLVLVGMPLVLLGQYLPERIEQAAEVAIGVIIVVLAVRLLARWRRGVFHAHAHSHDGDPPHRHLHSHADGSVHEHSHTTYRLRTLLAAYAVALFVFAAGTAVSMALLSTAFGLAVATGPIRRNFERVAPVLGVLAAAFGVWYAAGALGIVAYPF